jgi:hypothetical protein
MNQNIQSMTNSELKAYIKANRNDESACHEALKVLMSRRSENAPKYSSDLTTEEMQAVFSAKLQSKQ